MSQKSELSLPYVVVRFMSCIYGSRAIRFGGGVCDPNHTQYVPGPEPADRSDLTDEERDRVLRAAWREVRATGFRRCVVFSKDDRVYVEKEGPVGIAPMPSGGIWA
jgi:hypothetical protein